jgi:hypothetical protein
MEGAPSGDLSRRRTVEALFAALAFKAFRQHKQARHRLPTAHARARYRCFLPDLAGLAGMRRAGPMPDLFDNNIGCGFSSRHRSPLLAAHRLSIIERTLSFSVESRKNRPCARE